MKRFVLFAGTTEGRRIAEHFAGTDVILDVYAASEYGASLLPKAENVRIHAGRLAEDAIVNELSELRPDLCVDATHPYAAVVTENLRAACEETGISYLRVQRGETAAEGISPVYRASDTKDAAAYLNGTTGRILLTTGSKELHLYKEIEGFTERCYARVLPTVGVLEKCQELGLPASHIIAMQGPFSEALNVSMMRDLKIEIMVTKDSGEEGGCPEKYRAAAALGVKTVLIGRPETDPNALSLSDAISKIEDRFEISAAGCETEVIAKERIIAAIGMGPGDPCYLTQKAADYLRNADLLVGSKRMLEAAELAFPAAGKRGKFVTIKPYETVDYIREHSECCRAAVLYSGDSGRYSGAKQLRELLDREPVPGTRFEAMSGISSVQYFLSKLGAAEQEVTVLSAHGREIDLIPTIRTTKYVCALVGTADSAFELAVRLREYGLGNVMLTVGERLSYPDERIYRYEPEMGDINKMALIFAENPDPEVSTAGFGIADSEFIRAKVPMTKREVRSLTLSMLGLTEDGIFIDVGAGTGSISIEAARAMRRGRVYAVEKKEEAVELIRENAKKFHCSNLTVISGNAPEALYELPAPTSVFIGGSTGQMEAIVKHVLEVNPHAVIAANAVTEETIAELNALRGILPESKTLETTEISVVRSNPVGRYHMRQAENPIVIGVIRDAAKSE